MTTQMVLFAIGPDRPGLVSRISAVIHDGGGNFEDSRMATLAGDFALIVLFSADEASISRIQYNAAQLEAELGVTCQFKPASAKNESTGQVYEFEATGHDRPGIVSRLSAALLQNGANVITLDTSLVNMAFIGTPMFKVKGKIQIPETVDINELRDTLEDVCEDLALVFEFTLESALQ